MKLIQIVGLLVWIIFYSSYFIKLYLQKRRGIDVSRLARGVKPFKTKLIEICLFLLTAGTAVVQIISIMNYGSWQQFFTKEGNTGSLFFVAGTGIAAAGIIFFIAAMTEMKESWRAGIDEAQDTKLVISGIYKVSRNPAFVGFDLFYIGFGMLFPNGLMLLFALLSIFTLHIQIKEEEKYMEKKFGNDYLEYKKRVKRYFFRR